MVFAIHQHELATDIHVCPLLDPSPTSLLTTSLWVAPSFVCPASRIKLELAIYFTYGNVHVSMLFSQIIPPSPSPTESKSLFFTSVAKEIQM